MSTERTAGWGEKEGKQRSCRFGYWLRWGVGLYIRQIADLQLAAECIYRLEFVK